MFAKPRRVNFKSYSTTTATESNWRKLINTFTGVVHLRFILVPKTFRSTNNCIKKSN